MDIKSVRITRRHIVIDWTTPEGDFGLKLRDNPLPSFTRAVEALGALVLDILHLPTEYGKGLTATGITVADKQGTHLVCITAKKELTDCNAPFNIATPLRFLDHPKEEGTYSPPLTDAQVGLVEAVIKEAKKYVKGDRAQGQLPLGGKPDDEDGEGDGPAEPQEGDVLNFGNSPAKSAPEAKKPRKPRASASAKK